MKKATITIEFYPDPISPNYKPIGSEKLKIRNLSFDNVSIDKKIIELIDHLLPVSDRGWEEMKEEIKNSN